MAGGVIRMFGGVSVWLVVGFLAGNLHAQVHRWTRMLGTTGFDFAQGMAAGGEGDLFVAGAVSGSVDGQPHAGAFDVALVRVSTGGTVEWVRLFGSSSPNGEDYAAVACRRATGEVYVVTSASGTIDGNAPLGWTDMVLVKYDRAGNRVWTRMRGTVQRDIARAVGVHQESGEVYVAGHTNRPLDGETNAGGFDVAVVKYAADGTWLWTRLVGSSATEEGHACAVDGGGNVYVAGRALGSVGGQPYAGGISDALVVRISSGGVTQWVDLVGSSLTDAYAGVAVGPDGSVYAVGSAGASVFGQPYAGGDSDLLLVKYSSDGVRQWARLLGSSMTDTGYGVAVDAAGDVFVTGWVSASVGGQPYAGGEDVLVAKYSPAGDLRWVAMRGGSSGDRGYGIAVDGAGGVYVAGHASRALDGQTYQGMTDILLLGYGDVTRTPPTVSLVEPVDGSTVVLPSPVVLRATASDAESVVIQVTFYAGATVLFADTQSPWEYTWSGVSPGFYQVYAVAQDGDLMVSTSAAAVIRVRWPNQPPSVNMVGPVHDSTFSAPADVLLAAEASDADGSVVKVEFWRGTSQKIAEVTASPYVYTWTGLTQGEYWVGAVAYDNDGSSAAAAVMRYFRVVYERPPGLDPTVALVEPVHGSSFVAPADIALTAAVHNPSSAVVRVAFWQGSTMLGMVVTASPWTYVWHGVSSGTYALTAELWGAVDEVLAVSSECVVHVLYNPPPVVHLVAPVDGSTYTAPADIVLAATASDPNGTVAGVRFYGGATLLADDTASPYEYTWTGVSSGTYQLRAVARDDHGATGTSTVVTVTVLSSWTPAVWYTLTTAVNPPGGGTVSPASGTFLAGSQIQVTATPNVGYTFSNWSGDVTGGSPMVTVTMDADKTLTANFTYTPPVNSSPSVTIISPADGATYAAPASITVAAAATDSDGGVVEVRFYSGMTLLAADSTSPYEYTWTGVAAGSYILTAQVEDDGGAVGISSGVTVTVTPEPQPPQPQPDLRAGEVRVMGGVPGVNAPAGAPSRVIIAWHATGEGAVSVGVWDLRGRKVFAQVVDDGRPAAQVVWDTAGVPSGIYVVRVAGPGLDARVRTAVVQ